MRSLCYWRDQRVLTAATFLALRWLYLPSATNPTLVASVSRSGCVPSHSLLCLGRRSVLLFPFLVQAQSCAALRFCYFATSVHLRLCRAASHGEYPRRPREHWNVGRSCTDRHCLIGVFRCQIRQTSRTRSEGVRKIYRGLTRDRVQLAASPFRKETKSLET